MTTEISITDAQLTPYNFDFHSHLNGILPVESKFYGMAGSTQQRQLSMLGAVNPNLIANGTDGAAERKKAHIQLFTAALKYLSKHPELRIHEHHSAPIRGECAAENVYMACVILNARAGLGLGDIPSYSFYTGVADYLKGIDSVPEPLQLETYQIIRHFNHKIYSANKYTPFDDCYELRSAVTDGSEEDKDLWVNMTLDFQTQQGISHSQIATSVKKFPEQAKLFAAFNRAYGTQHGLLIQTANGYNSTEKLKKDLDDIKEKLLANWMQDGTRVAVGLDVLGQETGIIDHATVLEKAQKIYEAAQPPRPKMLTVHIHAGEGSGSAPHNRSLSGYWFCHAADAERHGAEFYTAFAAHILNAYQNACDHRAGHDAQSERWNQSAAPSESTKKDKLSRLFDEVFYRKSLTVRGITCRRYDLSSATTRALVAYNAKRNITVLAEHLAQANTSPNTYPYGQLAIRAGHALHYRNYLLKRTGLESPQLTCDTNLGSNFITGASTLFTDIESYRFNKGLRKLNGVFDIEYLERLKNSLTGTLKPDELKKENACIAQSLLIGADGQGIEHTDIQIEAMRQAMVLLLIEAPDSNKAQKTLEEFSLLLKNLASTYWKDTVGPRFGEAEEKKLKTGTYKPTFADSGPNTLTTLWLDPSAGGAGFVRATPFHNKLYRQD
jgi:hypothetical protein